MKFVDFICKDAIITDLGNTEKEDVIREMVEALAKAGQLPKDESENIITAILKREEFGSTGIGHGIAVPHTKLPTVDTLVGSVAVSKTGVDFASIDGSDVHLFFMVISPLDRSTDHLRVLERTSKQLQNETFCRFLKQSETIDDIWQLLEEADNDQFTS